MRKQRILPLLLAFALLFATACGGGNGSSTAESVPPAEQSAESASSDAEPGSQEEGASGASADFEPLEFTYMGAIWAPFDQDMMDIYNVAMEKTNTTINFRWLPQDNAQDQVAATLASGDIPEVFGMSSLIESTLIDQGALVNIASYYEDGSLANLDSKLTDVDYLYLRQPADGGIYILPMVMDYPPSMSWTIRKDWLENLELGVPTTWDEWMNVWTAFRDEDANGDGNATNEIPLSFAKTINYLTPIPLLHIHGINTSADGYFTVTDDGQYTFVGEHSRFRDFLETSRMLYEEKLLDAEFTSRENADLFKIMDNNTNGSAYTWAERVRLSTEVNREVDENATWIGVEPPVAPGGTKMITARNKISKTATITIGAEQKGTTQQIIQFFNWVYGEEGERLFSFGVEGDHYELMDGKPVLRDDIAAGGFVEARQIGLIPTPFSFVWEDGVYQQLLLAGQSYDEVEEPIQLFYDALHMHEAYFQQPYPTLSTPAYVNNQADLFPRFAELVDSCIMGRISVDDMLAEYETLKANGLQDIIDEGGEAYQRLVG